MAPRETLGKHLWGSKGLWGGLEGPKGTPRRANGTALKAPELPKGGLVGSKVVVHYLEVLVALARTVAK